jgi:hypothetical protein
VVAVDDQVLTLKLERYPWDQQDTRRILLSEIRGLEVRKARHSGALGAVAGLVIGGVLGFEVAGRTCHGSGDDEACLGTAFLGFIGGGLVGTIAGESVAHSEVWKPVPLPGQQHMSLLLGGTPHHGWGGGIRVGF